MKVVILAGGKGTRISEESQLRPKPMVEIGGKPILWHIMKIYSSYGYNDFIVCCGYKGHMIKKYFVDYYEKESNLRIDLGKEKAEPLQNIAEPWKVTLVNTGLETLTAGRILKIREYVGDEPFMLTYGDGVADIDINELVDFHKKQGRIATISSTQPEGRFGAIKIDDEQHIVESFKEKARRDSSWVNIGFAVFEPQIFSYLGEGLTMLEAEPYEKLAADRQMSVYKHNGFWSPMDNIHDRDYLEKLWAKNAAPWKLWN